MVRRDNTPWFVTGIANGDIISVSRCPNGEHSAGEMLRDSGHCTIRVPPLPDGPLGGSLQRVVDTFVPMGVTCEVNQMHSLVALDVAPTADQRAVKQRLEQGQRGRLVGVRRRLRHGRLA